MAKVSTRADMALIQGAKDIGKSMMPADLSGLDKVTEAGTTMALAGIEEIRKREQEKVDAFDEFTKTAEEVSLSAGSLGNVLYDDTVQFANQQIDAYLAALKNGDQAGMMAAKKAMADRSTFTQQHKTFIFDLAELQGEGDLSSAHSKEELDYMNAVLKGEYKVEKNDKGEMVFNVNGVKKTNAEFEDMYILKNYQVGETIGKLNLEAKKSSTFDRNSVQNTVTQSLPKNVKQFRASLEDDLGGGASFKDLLTNDKGLDQEILMGIGNYDPNGDGKVDENEKANFLDAVTNHKNPNFNLDVSRRIMAHKLTNVIENGHSAHWEGVAKAKQDEITNEYLFEKYKNDLRKDLDAAQTGNDIIKAASDHQNDIEQINLKEKNIRGRDQAKKGIVQADVRNFWNKQDFDNDAFRQKGPTDKALLYAEAFKEATGNTDVNIKYSGKPFKDSSGRTVQKGYYVVRQEDVFNKEGIATGEKKAVNQIIGIGEDITADNIMAFIDSDKSMVNVDNTLSGGISR